MNKPRDPGTLKAATADLITDAGGLEKARDLCRVGISQLQRYSDPEVPEASVPADVVLALETHAGTQPVTRFLAAKQGMALVPIESTGQPQNLAVEFARTAREASQAFACFAEASCHPSLSTHDRRTMLREFDDLLDAVTRLERCLLADPNIDRRPVLQARAA